MPKVTPKSRALARLRLWMGRFSTAKRTKPFERDSASVMATPEKVFERYLKENAGDPHTTEFRADLEAAVKKAATHAGKIRFDKAAWNA
jgi:hypothetical protein